MTSNLTTELRADKNGKLVTRHVRKGNGVSGVAKSIPAPRAKKRPVAPVVSSEEAYEGAVAKLIECGLLDNTNVTPPSNFGVNLKELANESTVLLGEVVEHISKTEGVARQSWEWMMLSRMMHDPEKIGANGGDMYKARIAVESVLLRIAQETRVYSAVSIAESIMHEADQYVAGKHGKGYRSIKAAVIVTGMNAINEESPDGILRYEQKHKDFRYIEKNIDSVELVLDELIERKTADPEVIAQLIDQNSSFALNRGAL